MVGCAGIGNSEAVAAKHYLQLTDEHFQLVIQPSAGSLQNPVQYPADSSRMVSQGQGGVEGETAFCGPIQKNAAPCNQSAAPVMPPQGLEP